MKQTLHNCSFCGTITSHDYYCDTCERLPVSGNTARDVMLAIVRLFQALDITPLTPKEQELREKVSTILYDYDS